ncbi:hypothetical protein [Paludisphaera mucosa]|uniref:Uncharacterized protein n=1 Tax=Paludisphaera mucosa TaxID=3030827 RepID=A0ABT6F3Q5_9BACT|nr:hypothetical protein [Paludisphaera mucosa]
MRFTIKILLAVVAFAGGASAARADIVLGTAGDFAVLAGTTVTNTGPTAATSASARGRRSRASPRGSSPPRSRSTRATPWRRRPRSI